MKNTLHKKGTAKFVLLLGNDKSYFLASDVSADLHSDIVDKVDCHSCLGGGRLTIKEDSVIAYGYSIGYGQADSDKVEVLLKEQFQDKQIIMRMGQGY